MKTSLNHSFLKWLWVSLVGLSLILSGCSAGPTPTEEVHTTDTGESQPGIVSATGEVRPERWAELSLATAGRVSEVLVSEGDAVVAGQLLAKLEGGTDRQADLEAARYELARAQQALDTLNQQAAVNSALAQQDESKARLEVITAQRELEPYTETSYEDDVDRLRQDVVDAKDKLKEAQDDFDPYKDFDPENATRKTYEDRLQDAQQDYDEKQRKLDELELEKTRAEQALSLAQAHLEQAKLQVEHTAAGPDVGDLNTAQARLANAQAAQAAAEAALADLELHAPFDGVVTRLFLRTGEWTLPGDAALTLADLSTLRVETTDLNEIDAARVSLGDSVIVTFDGLPEVTARGKVTRIALQAAEGTGVNYTVVVELDELPEALRWGMTAFVDIKVGE